jgi:hypothetical protein
MRREKFERMNEGQLIQETNSVLGLWPHEVLASYESGSGFPVSAPNSNTFTS